MSNRDELAEVIANFRDDWYKTERKAPAGIDRDEAAHILAAGYSKQPEPKIEWGVGTKWGRHAFGTKAGAEENIELHRQSGEEARLVKRTAAGHAGPWEEVA